MRARLTLAAAGLAVALAGLGLLAAPLPAQTAVPSSDASPAPGANAALPRTVAAHAAPAEPSRDATLRVLNRDVITFRASLAGASPAARVARAEARLREIPQSELDQPLRTVPFSLGDARGVSVLIGDRLLFAVLREDADAEANQSFDALVKQTRERLEDVRQAWHDLRDRPTLIRGALHAGVATLVFAALVWGLLRGSRVMFARLERWRDELAAMHRHVDRREFFARVTVRVAQLVQWLVLAVLAYAWLQYVFERFPLTEPLARDLGQWLWGQLVWVAEGALGSVPGLITVVIVLFFTRAVADGFGYVFESIQQGRLRVPFVHPETTTATRRIVSLVTWGLGIAVAYPYLPGSSSDAFKGLSVLFGVMVTLGSSGIVTQAMSGLVVIYARALRKGDYVEIGGVQGVVTEVAALATKIVNVRNEEITIPNSVLVASPIHNYSKLAGSRGTLLSTCVTIGYDAPWRQVHAMLIEAAGKTPGVRADPAPYVYQRALSDFYVEYELFLSVDEPRERVRILSDLHAAIQDAFNERGVQIMSPHFFDQPPAPVVVPRSRWHEPPAAPPAEPASRR